MLHAAALAIFAGAGCTGLYVTGSMIWNNRRAIIRALRMEIAPMPNYRILFQRDVTITETVERVIEAASLEDAEERADALAFSFDHDCPDDATECEGTAEFGGWSAGRGALTAAPADIAGTDSI